MSAWLRSNHRLLLLGPCHHSRSKYARVESGISLRQMRLDMLQAIRDRSNEVGAGRTLGSSRLRILVSRTGKHRQGSVAARSTASASGLGSKADAGLNEAVFLPHQVQEIHVVLPRIVRRRRLCLLSIPRSKFQRRNVGGMSSSHPRGVQGYASARRPQATRPQATRLDSRLDFGGPGTQFTLRALLVQKYKYGHLRSCVPGG